jgi:hypothetical protein
MPAKKATKTANLCVTIYEGDFDISFDCVGVEMCRFALCPVMPPTGEEECTFREHGTCRSASAKVAALELLSSRIKRERRQYDDDEG